MKVIEFGRFGAPHEVCRCIDVDAPGPPGADQLVVEIAACPINPADLLTIAGSYPGPTELPARAGIEGAGRVVALGDDITAFAVGDPVISLVRANWAERVVLKESQAIKLPAGIDMRQAAMLKANPASAHLMLDTYVGLKDGVALKDGDWVIQNAANSRSAATSSRSPGRAGCTPRTSFAATRWSPSCWRSSSSSSTATISPNGSRRQAAARPSRWRSTPSAGRPPCASPAVWPTAAPSSTTVSSPARPA